MKRKEEKNREKQRKREEEKRRGEEEEGSGGWVWAPSCLSPQSRGKRQPRRRMGR